MGRPLLTVIVLAIALATRAFGAPTMQFQREGEWVTASAYLPAADSTVTAIIADVAAYNEFLPSFMRSAPVGTDSQDLRLRIRVNLPWPCKDIDATFARVAAGEGIYHWEYVEGNIDGGSMELSARPYGDGTLVACLMHVQLPHWCPDWVLGVLAKRVLAYVLREIERKVEA